MLVGFDLSGVVRKKVPGAVSAGRVQSPALRLIVEREQAVPLDEIVARAIDRGLIAGVTGANSINVRFVNGSGFKLTMDMFSFSNVNGGDIPGTDFLISEADGAERGVLLPEAAVMLNGVNLYKDGDAGTKVEFFEIDPVTGEISGVVAAEVTSFETKGPNALKFAWPSALEQGKAYFAVPSRSADGALWFTGSGKAATVKEG